MTANKLHFMAKRIHVSFPPKAVMMSRSAAAWYEGVERRDEVWNSM
jgi:hypothetical protein